MSTTFLEKSQSAGNRQTWTMSMWIKTSVNNDEQPLFSSASNSDNQDLAYIEAGGNLRWWTYQSAAYVGQLRTSRVLRDANAWYHLVFVFDSTNATADDRMRIYINGVQETSFAARNNPAQNSNTLWNGTLDQTIGLDASGGYVDKFDGSMSHIHFIDGTAYDATAFGQYDANGVWTIKTSPSVTYGTNGFFILKDGNSVTDQSGNSNNFTVQASGTLTKTEDSPSNVFAVWNALDKHASSTLSNGNTKYTTSGTSQYEPAKCTLGFSAGKYYSEHQINSLSTTACFIGIYGTSVSGQSQSEMDTLRFSYNVKNGEIIKNASNLQTGLATFTTNDILGIEVDCDSGTLKFYKNGTQVGTTITDSDISSTEWTFGTQPRLATFSSNFGNGYFGTTAVASAGTNASGNGIFEYDVPTGYTALSTKGLNL